jgi:hypothetical protein
MKKPGCVRAFFVPEKQGKAVALEALQGSIVNHYPVLYIDIG